MPESGDITRLLHEARAGDREAFDRVIPLVYEELRVVARRQLAQERVGHTLDSAALVHEAYLRLAKLDRIEWQDRTHFLALAARLMRRILVDHAKSRAAAKRGAAVEPVTLDDLVAAPAVPLDQLAELDEALTRLEALNPRQCHVVECRFFGGLSAEDTAVALDVSVATVKRDWTLARAWLNRELA